MAPVYQGGFEVRLAVDAPQVGLHQYVLPEDDQPAQLLAHLQRMISPDVTSQRLVNLCRAWSASHSPLAISELWLECDGTAAPSPRPSFFFGLPSPSQAGATQEVTALGAAQHVVTDGQLAAFWPAVRRCFAACREPARVSHLGVLAGRASLAMRVNVKGLPGDQIVPYLEETGWRGPRAELTDVVGWLTERVDGVTVCVDAPSPGSVGFECAWSGQPPTAPGWRRFLDDLVDRGACAPRKRDALLGWPEVITPPTSRAPWPAPLIVAALGAPTDRFGAIGCRVSHIKVTYEPGRALSAKGYLSFAHTLTRRSIHSAATGSPSREHGPSATPQR